MTDSTNNTIKVPEWLETKLFEQFLKENVESFNKIEDIKTKPNLSAREMYSNVMTEVEILMELKDGHKETKYFTLKTNHETKFHKELNQEPLVYEELIPAFEYLYKDVGKDIQFAPKYFVLPIAKEHILLEYLCGGPDFKVAHGSDCLNMKHAKIVLQKMAEWHAVSAVHKEHIGCYGDNYKTGIFNETDRKLMAGFLERKTKYLLKCIHLFRNHEEYKSEIETMLHCVMVELLKASQVDDLEFNVLNHGDCRTNNIIFQYSDKGEPIDCRFMNFDIPKYGSPAQDLLYFIISSLQVDIKIKQFDHLIQYYHEQLIENLQLLDYPKDMPTLKDILIMLYKYGIWGFITAIGVLPAVLDDSSATSTSDQSLGDCDHVQTFKLMMMTNKDYIKQMNTILPWLLNRGCLDYNID